jgi:hypothetical protein
VLVTIDAKTQKLWLLCTASKKPLIHILRWLFSNLRPEGRTIACTQVDEDGALICSFCCCCYIRDEEGLVLETNGGYASYLNGKIERPNHTIAERFRCFLINAGFPKQDWCYAAEHAA